MKKLILMAAVALIALPAAAQNAAAYPSYIQVTGPAAPELTPHDFSLSLVLDPRTSTGTVSRESPPPAPRGGDRTEWASGRSFGGGGGELRGPPADGVARRTTASAERMFSLAATGTAAETAETSPAAEAENPDARTGAEPGPTNVTDPETR